MARQNPQEYLESNYGKFTDAEKALVDLTFDLYRKICWLESHLDSLQKAESLVAGSSSKDKHE